MDSKKNDWDQIIPAHQAFLVRHAEQRISRRYWYKIDPRSAVQEALTKAFAAKNQFQGNAGQQRGYLLQILKRTIVDRWRRLGGPTRKADLEDPLAEEHDSASPVQLSLSSRASPERHVQGRQALRFALEKFAQLPDDQRAVLECELVHGLTDEAIARELGLTAEDVKVLSRRGHRRLRKHAGEA